MLNKKPIFVNGFQRGGTNLFVNIYASHPQVSTVGMEMHEMFYGVGSNPLSKVLNRLINLPVILFSKNYFKISNLNSRLNPPKWVQRSMDWQLYLHKLLASENYRKGQQGRYSLNEVAQSRIVVKNVNGVVMISRHLEKYYPDAVFISIIRNGYALCEGFLRRGWDARIFGEMYQTVSDAIWKDSRENPKHLVVKFEDLVEDPGAMLEKLYDHAGLSKSELHFFRMHAKAAMRQDGTRDYLFGGGDRQEIWLPLDEFEHYFMRDVNQNQISQLREEQKRDFLEAAQKAMDMWGYL